MFSTEQLKRLTDLFLEYVEVKSEIIKEQVKGNMAQIITNLMVIMMFMGIGLLIVLLGCFALSFYLNDVLQSSFLGFVLVMAALFLFSIFLYINRKTLVKSIVLKTISKYFRSEHL